MNCLFVSILSLEEAAFFIELYDNKNFHVNGDILCNYIYYIDEFCT